VSIHTPPTDFPYAALQLEKDFLSQKVVFGVFMDGFDSLAISNEAEQVDGEDLLVGRIRVGIVAL
jgi:hypothetical protein